MCKVWVFVEGIVDGVILVCDLVNELFNVLGLVEFVGKVVEFEKFGVEVEIFGEKEMKKFKMVVMLGVV